MRLAGHSLTIKSLLNRLVERSRALVETPKPVLAKNATQVATAKEYGAGPLPTSQAIFLAKMSKRAGDDGITPRTANELFVVEAIHVTVAGTGAAIRQFFQCALGSSCEFTTTVQRQVSGLETLKRETFVQITCAGSCEHD